MLTRLDDLAYEQSELGTVVSESVALQYVLGKLMLAGKSLIRKDLATSIRGRHQHMKKSQIIPREALVIKNRESKKSKDTPSTDDESKEKSRIICFQCERLGHVQTKGPLRRVSGCVEVKTILLNSAEPTAGVQQYRTRKA